MQKKLRFALTVRAVLCAALLVYHVGAVPQQPAPTPIESGKEKQNQAAETRQHSATQPSGTDQSPVVIKVLPTPRTKEQADYEAYEHHEKPANERLITWATIALAIITLGLAIFTALLWFATYKLARDAKATADRQVGEVATSLALAEKSATAAEKSAAAVVAQLRAYVLMHNASISPIDTETVVTSTVLIKNSGQSPAFDVVHVGLTALGIYPLRDFPRPDESFPRTKTFLPPGADSTLVIPTQRLTQEEVAAITAGKKAIYVVGWITYKDVFGNDRFCNYRLLTGGAQGVRPGALFAADEGNEAN